MGFGPAASTADILQISLTAGFSLSDCYLSKFEGAKSSGILPSLRTFKSQSSLCPSFKLAPMMCSKRAQLTVNRHSCFPHILGHNTIVLNKLLVSSALKLCLSFCKTSNVITLQQLFNCQYFPIDESTHNWAFCTLENYNIYDYCSA